MSKLLDLIFPKFCLGCAVEGTYFCPSCQTKIIMIKHQTCPACHVLTDRGAWCQAHQEKQALAGIMSLGYYHDPLLREAIHWLKYRRVDDLANALAHLASSYLGPLVPHSKVILIPIPLHPWRKRSRDFNQAELLAQKLASLWQLTHLPDGLIRTKVTQPQIDLPHQKRLTNVSDVFAWPADSRPIKGKTIWLVDDVATTGATLEASAKVLKQNGAKSVWGVVLAKG